MRLLFLICFLFVALFVQAQFPITQNQGSPTTLIKTRGGQQVDSGLIIGSFADTTAANAGFIDAIPGIIIRTISPVNTLWYRNSLATRWLSIGTADSITGKLNISDTAAMLAIYIRQAYRVAGQDSIRFIRGDGTDFAVLDSTGLDSLITDGIIEINAPENHLLRYGGDNWRNTYRTDSSILPKAVTDSLYVTEVIYTVGAGVDTLRYVKDGDTTTIGVIVQSGGGGGGGNSGTYLVSGGQVVWTGTGLIFFIQAATYYINGTLYSSRDTTVELTAADPTDPRIDGFVVDTTGQGYFITGVAAAIAVPPQADATYQLFLTSVPISANDTIPAITNAVIYNNQDVGEWAPSSPVLFPIDFLQSTVSYVPPYAADFLSGGPSRYASFDLAPDSLNLNDYISISAFVKLKANLNNQNMGISVQMFKGSTPVTNQVRFAINRTTTEWQAVQLPLGAFTYLGAQRYVDSISVIYRNFNGTGAIAGMYFDYFTFNNGIAPPSSGGNFVQQVRRKQGTDSVQQLINNVWQFAFIDSIGGGSGGVDSIWRTAGVDSIYFTIGGTQYAIKDSTGGGNQNFANTDLTATGNRSHDFTGAYLDIIRAKGIALYAENAANDSLSRLVLSALDVTPLADITTTLNGQSSSLFVGHNYVNLQTSDSIRLLQSAGQYSPTTTSTAKYKAVLMDSTTGALVTTSPSNIGGGITELTGDVTAGPGSGSQAATIANNAVTYAKMQQMVGLSVLGNSTNGTANMAAITSGTDHHALRQSGTSIGFGLLNAGAMNGTYSNGQTLQTNGSGVLSWVTPSTGIPSDSLAIRKSGPNLVHITSYNSGYNSATVGSSAAAARVDSANLFIGLRAGQSGTTGYRNIGIGRAAYKSATTGYLNIAIGDSAMGNGVLTGTFNIAVGQRAGSLIANGAGNVLVGSFAGRSITSGNSNVFFGGEAGQLVSTGSNNTAIGAAALYNSTTVSEQTAVGQQSLFSATGSQNTALGYAAGYNITSGTYNLAIGRQAMGQAFSSVTGTGNTVLGNNTSLRMTSADYNTIITNLGASSSLANLSTGDYNTIIGATAENTLSTGSRNIMLAANSSSLTMLASGSDDNIHIITNSINRLSNFGSNNWLFNVSGAAVTTATASAALEINGTTGGFIIPRMNVTQAGALTASNGMMIYVTNTDATFTAVGFWGYENSTWVKL